MLGRRVIAGFDRGGKQPFGSKETGVRLITDQQQDGVYAKGTKYGKDKYRR